MVKDDTLQISFSGGPCDGRKADIDPKDAGLRIEAAPWQDRAVVLAAATLPSLPELRGKWELYERDPGDDLRYRHVPDDEDFLAWMYDHSNAGEDRWTWSGWGGWGDPRAGNVDT
jgi:hypothetical protein